MLAICVFRGAVVELSSVDDSRSLDESSDTVFAYICIVLQCIVMLDYVVLSQDVTLR